MPQDLQWILPNYFFPPHQQEFCLSPFPELFMYMKCSFSQTFISSQCCSSHSLDFSFSRLQEELSRETSLTCPGFEFLRLKLCLYTCFLFCFYFSLDSFFFLKMEEKLHQCWFSTFIYCSVVCMLEVCCLQLSWPFSTIPHTGERLKMWGPAAQTDSISHLGKPNLATLHPPSHHRCQ